MPAPAVPMASPPPSGGMREPRDLSALTRGWRASDASKAMPPTVATAASGALLFELTAHREGVHVMRIHGREGGGKVYCSVLFDNERTFLDWLDSDTMRFTHPLVFQQARRCFAQLMAEKDHHDTARK